MKKWKTTKHTIIIRLFSVKCNCYVVKKNGKYILIDTSVRIEREIIQRQLKKIGIKQLEAIFITHAHTDHVGNAAYFQRKYKCPVYVNQLEYNYMVKGFCELPKGTNAYARFIYEVITKMKIFETFEPVEYVRMFKEKCHIKGFEDSLMIIKLDGHTKGSTSIIVDNEIAVVGDTMIQRRGSIYPPFANHIEELPKSWRQLLQYKCWLYLPGHGKEITRKCVSRSLRSLSE